MDLRQTRHMVYNLSHDLSPRSYSPCQDPEMKASNIMAAGDRSHESLYVLRRAEREGERTVKIVVRFYVDLATGG